MNLLLFLIFSSNLNSAAVDFKDVLLSSQTDGRTSSQSAVCLFPSNLSTFETFLSLKLSASLFTWRGDNKVNDSIHLERLKLPSTPPRARRLFLVCCKPEFMCAISCVQLPCTLFFLGVIDEIHHRLGRSGYGLKDVERSLQKIDSFPQPLSELRSYCSSAELRAEETKITQTQSFQKIAYALFMHLKLI